MSNLGQFSPTYDPRAVQPMRDELTRVGVLELLTPEEVDAALAKKGTTLVVVNSVCGCAAGGARPGVMIALQHRVIPDQLTAVFAGMERAATERARSHFKGYPPSSPCVALLVDGEVAGMLQRHDIEGRAPQQVASALTALFDSHCTRPGPSIPREELEKLVPVQACGSSIPRFGGG
ncbi:MAG: BrxA/BrxB family bacilliredoxin [Planctomycetes bacterium]|nr:BrxA/BrxB family bacilliredoxin [Planctomycetota bacterium]